MTTVRRIRGARLRAWLGVGLALGATVNGPVHAQYLWRVYRAGDGLAESLTRTVTVSPRGTVWARHGETESLSVLDGYQVRHVPSPEGRIQRVYQSRAGRVWSTYDRGLLQLIDEQWQRHPVEAIRYEYATNPLRLIGQTPIMPAGEDRVLVLLPDRIIEYRALSQQTVSWRMAAEEGIGAFLDLARTEDDGLWIAGEQGLLLFAGPLRRLDENSSGERFVLPPELGVRNLQRPLPDGRRGVTCVAEEPDANRRVVVHFDGAGWSKRVWGGENPRFAWPGSTPETYWAMTYTRLAELDGGISGAESVPFQAGQYFDIATEGEGAFWLATSEGLARCAPAAWRRPLFTPVANTPVTAGVEDASGRLWFAAGNGLVSLDGEDWSLVAWPAGFEFSFRPGDQLRFLPDGRLAVAVEEQLWLFAPATQRFASVVHPRQRRIGKVLRQTGAGLLCVETQRVGDEEEGYQLELFDGAGFLPWTNAPPPIDLGAELFFLAEASNGDLWLGGSAGPARWREGQWQVFSHADGYDDEGALCWLELPDGHIWCAGLSRVSAFDGKRWNTLREGLDRVNGLVRTTDGSVWVATGSGLHRHFNGEWVQVDPAEGLPGALAHCALEDHRRRLWAGTSRGLSLLHPRADIDPPITLAVESAPFPEPDSVNGLRVVFRGRDKWRFTEDDRLLFSHRLDEGEWSAFHPRAEAVLADLTAGPHRLEVRAMDRNWNIEAQPFAFEFAVLLPWYHDPRVVAIGGVAVLLVVALLALAVSQHIQLRRSCAEVGRQVAERTEELKRATEALVQGQKMTALGTLAAGIAHDFNNILSIIKGSAQIIAANLDDRAKVRARLDRIQASIDQASGVIHAMLGFGRAGRREAQPCEINALVAETVRLLGDRFRREVRVSTRLAGGLPRVLAVRDLTQQMLLNLILNALDATAGTGLIQVRTDFRSQPGAGLLLAPRSAPAYVALSVEDHGAGIAPDVRPRIFEPFFTTKAFSARHGTGLGLYMVYEFALEMGFGIQLDSSVGKGTTFTIVLPVAPPETSVRAEA